MYTVKRAFFCSSEESCPRFRAICAAIVNWRPSTGSYVFGAILAGILLNTVGTPAMAFSVERQGNHLFISGDIGPESPATFNRNLVESILELALAGDQQSPVYLHLNLPRGGDADASFKLVEIIRTAQSHGTQIVAKVGPGTTCMSGCTFLFLAASERWIAPEGRLIFHGFSQANPERPVEVPSSYHLAYDDLLKSANVNFYRFFKMARIIEDDRKVGFTGQTLYDHKAFSGLITGLMP